VAAAYIDFLTNAHAAEVLVQTDNLPAMPTTTQPATPLSRDVFAAWKKLTDAEGLVPYLDYSTPTFYDDVSAAIQKLLGGKSKAQEFTQGVQSSYGKFIKTL
jgi:raffinose/stachyose/melibiose transport system substrate-binding protein